MHRDSSRCSLSGGPDSHRSVRDLTIVGVREGRASVGMRRESQSSIHRDVSEFCGHPECVTQECWRRLTPHAARAIVELVDRSCDKSREWGVQGRETNSGSSALGALDSWGGSVLARRALMQGVTTRSAPDTKTVLHAEPRLCWSPSTRTPPFYRRHAPRIR